MKKQTLIKSLTLTTLLVSLTTLSSCTDEEIATVIGVGAIIGGAAIIDNNSYCVGGYRTACHTYHDYFGYPRTECRQVYDRCAYRRIRHEVGSVDNFVEFSIPTESSAGVPEVSNILWGEKFNLSFEGSQVLIEALSNAQGGNIEALYDLGFKKQDLRLIARMQLPTDSGIKAVAQNLGASQETVRQMMTMLAESAKANRAEIEKAVRK
jgi:hypothetical protein